MLLLSLMIIILLTVSLQVTNTLTDHWQHTIKHTLHQEEDCCERGSNCRNVRQYCTAMGMCMGNYLFGKMSVALHILAICKGCVWHVVSTRIWHNLHEFNSLNFLNELHHMKSFLDCIAYTIRVLAC